ncbi:tetratricopeptide repeat protein 12 isoform X2 [Drosophila montana]|uniref:tetratricopeptide repeat protein 12 isoform X2 n=1 Tax=Drosophila montana TaxID=40370 RepID=UPI00313C62BC
MRAAKHREFEEDFLRTASKVDDFMKFLTEMGKSKMDAGKDTDAKVEINYSAAVTDDNFMVLARSLYFARKTKMSSRKVNVRSNMNQMSFMRQIDASHEERIKAREERIRVASNYRRLGNFEYRNRNFEKAIEHYTKGLQYIPDSPVLYTNRSLCYIKKREFKRALLDLDFVIMNLDGRCLRAWLYRAGTLKRMNDEAGYQECIDSARRLNHGEEEYIEYFIKQSRTDL